MADKESYNKGDPESTDNVDDEEEEDEYLHNCVYEKPEGGQEVPDLVEEPEESAPRRSARRQNSPEIFNPYEGRSYEQVVAQKEVTNAPMKKNTSS